MLMDAIEHSLSVQQSDTLSVQFTIMIWYLYYQMWQDLAQNIYLVINQPGWYWCELASCHKALEVPINATSCLTIIITWLQIEFDIGYNDNVCNIKTLMK